MKNSKRLDMIIGLCPKCGSIADIGCDHAYASIALARENRAEHIYACDLREGPLHSAAINIKEAGLGDRISIRLGDGINAVSENVDCVLISGMGGLLIDRILRDVKARLDGISYLVISPQSDRRIVRKSLRELGFLIKDERDCFDDGKYYQCIFAVNGRIFPEEGSEEESLVSDEFGPVLIKNKSMALREYAATRHKKLKGICKEIEDNGGRPNSELALELSLLDKVIELTAQEKG